MKNRKRMLVTARAVTALLILLTGFVPGTLQSVSAAPGQTTRASVDSSGAQANGESFTRSQISGNGRFVVFASDASNLVAGDTNGVSDVFVYDRQTGVTTRESVATGGAQAGGGDLPDISGDGRYVVFVSTGADLGTVDTNGVDDIYVHDRQTGSTTRVSVATGGTQANDLSDAPVISADGRYVAFGSSATNLVSGDTNGEDDVFVHDRVGGATVRVSVDSAGGQPNAFAGTPAISADGGRVAFLSGATNLVASDTNNRSDIFVHDMLSGVTSLASVATDGTQANMASLDPAISGNGRYVAFSTSATNLITEDTFSYDYIYVHDMQTATTTAVLLDSNGFQLVADSFAPSLSFDGRFVAFGFDDKGDGIAFFSVMLQDRQNHATSIVPASTTGGPPNDSSWLPSISDDGVFVAFSSDASNLVTGDTNGVQDIFVRESADEPGSPSVSAVTPVDPNPTSAAVVTYTVDFSEIVFGVDAADFSIATTGGISGTSVSNVTGTGATRTVTINTGAGDGTLRLDVLDDDTIHDSAAVPLGGAGAGNGAFNTAAAYTIDKSMPVVTGSLRADPNPSAAASVHFTVNFSESVSGVDATDFTLTTAGISGASVTTVSGSGATYTVTVATGTGNGTIRLDVVDNDSILDGIGNALGGAGAGNGNFTTGEVYNIEKTPGTTITPPPPPTATPRPPVLQTARIRSNGLNDGWVLESSEDSGQGGTKKSNGDTIRIGDDSADRQYRGILHFPTSSLPDNAVITMAVLTFKGESIAGTDPFTTHQNMLVDIRNGPFGSIGPFSINGLQVSDFQAPASMSPAAIILNNPVGGWYWALLDTNALQFINTAGVTQFRLAFQLDDNDDLGNDYLSILSGDAVSITDRPHLVITYYAP